MNIQGLQHDKNLNKRINENSGKISAALFEHDTSRKLTRSLHTHCVLHEYDKNITKNGVQLIQMDFLQF